MSCHPAGNSFPCSRMCVPDPVCVFVCVCVGMGGGGEKKKPSFQLNNFLGITLYFPGFFCPAGQRNSLRNEQKKILFLHAGKHTGFFAWKFLGRPQFVSVSCVSLTLFMNFHNLDGS